MKGLKEEMVKTIMINIPTIAHGLNHGLCKLFGQENHFNGL